MEPISKELKAGLLYVSKKFSKLSHNKINNEFEFVVLYCNDKSEAYETNVEEIGVSAEGNLIWAFCSGCSCSGGAGVDDEKTLKILEIKELDEDIQNLLLEGIKKLKNWATDIGMDLDDY
jgi:hypothetical protein